MLPCPGCPASRRGWAPSRAMGQASGAAAAGPGTDHPLFPRRPGTEPPASSAAHSPRPGGHWEPPGLAQKAKCWPAGTEAKPGDLCTLAQHHQPGHRPTPSGSQNRRLTARHSQRDARRAEWSWARGYQPRRQPLRHECFWAGGETEASPLLSCRAEAWEDRNLWGQRPPLLPKPCCLRMEAQSLSTREGRAVVMPCGTQAVQPSSRIQATLCVQAGRRQASWGPEAPQAASRVGRGPRPPRSPTRWAPGPRPALSRSPATSAHPPSPSCFGSPGSGVSHPNPMGSPVRPVPATCHGSGSQHSPVGPRPPLLPPGQLAPRPPCGASEPPRSRASRASLITWAGQGASEPLPGLAGGGTAVRLLAGLDGSPALRICGSAHS